MRQAAKVFRDSLRDFYDDGALLIAVNILWVGLSLPLITLPPATGGLYYVTNRIAHGYAVQVRTFFEGFRQYFIKSWQLALANLLVLAMTWANLVFYRRLNNLWLWLPRILLLYILLFWLAMQMYSFPLLLEQEDKRLKLVLRNAALLVLADPLFTVILAVLLLAAVALSAALTLPLILVTASFVSLVANRAVLTLLMKHRAAKGEK
ncbi:MAG: DUF624 domain-containing protein [Anaerolineae bacterium]